MFSRSHNGGKWKSSWKARDVLVGTKRKPRNNGILKDSCGSGSGGGDDGATVTTASWERPRILFIDTFPCENLLVVEVTLAIAGGNG